VAPPLHLCLDEGHGDAALDTAVARALLERVDAGELPATVRLSRPTAVVAFSRQDARAPGFATAVASARGAGSDVVLRLAGGRAAVFHPGTIAFSWSTPSPTPIEGITDRYRMMSDVLSEAFRRFGIDTRVGEIPGEYCPGRWSVSIEGRWKVAGMGQWLLRKAAHTGGVVVVDDADAIVRVLTPVYDALELEWEPAVTGALTQAADVTWEGVRQAIADAFATRFEVHAWDLDTPTLARARTLAEEHRVEVATW
jgi:octanoyl-[GcvH]:protein N-octanoyltransferase